MKLIHFLGLLFFLVASCATSKIINSTDLPDTIKPVLPKNYLHVPLKNQKTVYSCGVASLTAVLHYWQVFNGEEEELYGELGTNHEGTDSPPIIKAAQRLKLEAIGRNGLTLDDLKRFRSEGKTAILSFQAWSDEDPVDYRKATEDGHYAVLVALDDHYLYLMDPSLEQSYGYLTHSQFLDRWHDGGQERSGIIISGNKALSEKNPEVFNTKLQPIR